MVMFHSYVSLLEGTNHKVYQIPAGGIGDVFSPNSKKLQVVLKYHLII